MKTITLTQGKVALVDDEDHEALSKFRWFAAKNPVSLAWYARRAVTTGIQRPKQRYVIMHMDIIGVRPGLFGDHVNGDTLDNRRSNLRHATPTQNRANQAPYGRTGYKGVVFYPSKGLWKATCQGEHLKYHATPEAAARAYDEAAVRHYGAFARLNFPQEVAV